MIHAWSLVTPAGLDRDGPVLPTGRASDVVWSAPHSATDAAWLAALVLFLVVVLTSGQRPLAARLGLFDDAADAPDRKRHARPVPLVLGLVTAIALVALALVHGPEIVGGHVVGPFGFAPRAVWLAAAAAFATGIVDDFAPRGLGPIGKLGGQLVAGCALASGFEIDGAPAGMLVRGFVVIAAVAAQNAANTFDNADGALCGVTALGFAFVGPFAAVFLAMLPMNLPRAPFARRAREDHAAQRTPRAWLGDAGSHLVGILLLTTPVAWAALVVPGLDLARVVVARYRAGDAIWRGDRRHAAHALQDRGFAPAVVVVILIVATLPAVVIARILA